MDEQERDDHRQEGRDVPGMPGTSAADPGVSRTRRRYTAAQKRALLEEFSHHGQSMREFCAQHALSTTTFCKWRLRHTAEGEAGLEPRPNRRNHTRRTGRHATPGERKAAVEAFAKAGTTRKQFARTWGITTNTLASWLKASQAGTDALAPRRPGRPRASARRPLGALAQEILRIKQRFPLFGLRKVRDYLLRFLGLRVSASQVRSTLAAAGLPPTPLVPKRHRSADQVRRFERARPGELWQSDITSFLLTRHSRRTYLTVFLDDHSRYVVSFSLRLRQTSELVTETLLDGIARFGKPQEVLTDQGRQYFAWRGRSEFEKLLLREGIKHVVSRAHHPETLGKCERLWETISREFWQRVHPQELTDARERLAHFFAFYNHFRPHQSLGGLVPADRFFGAEDVVRKAIEQQLSQNELSLAVDDPVRKPVFFFGQIGDRQVSLHGERGKLVIQTPEGLREELSLEETNSRGAESHERDDRDSSAARKETTTPLPQAPLQAAAAAGDRGATAVGASERGGEEAGAPAVHDDSPAMAGQDHERAGDGGTRAATAAPVAIEPASSLRDDCWPLEATTDATERDADGVRPGERSPSVAEADRAAREGAGLRAQCERPLAAPALEPRGEHEGGLGPPAEDQKQDAQGVILQPSDEPSRATSRACPGDTGLSDSVSRERSP
jgi:transposase InsO family protein